MDTKSKKFDRFLITKITAFLLALVFTFIGTYSALRFVDMVENNESYTDAMFENALSQGKDFNLFTSTMFLEHYNDYMQRAYRKALIFGDESKEAYERADKIIENQINTRLNSEKKELIKKLTGNSSYIWQCYFLEYLSQNKISVKKVADHKNHSLPENVYSYYDPEEGLVINDDGDIYYSYSDYFDDDDYENDDDDIYETTYIPSPSEAVTTYSYYNGSGYPLDYNTISDQIAEKAGSCDCVVNICNCIYSNTVYDGYYAVTVNTDDLKKNIQNEALMEGNLIYYKFSSYEDFKKACAENDEWLAAYKNISFAIRNNETGIVSSSIEKLNGKVKSEKLDEIFLSYQYSFSRNYSTYEVKTGSEFSKIPDNTSNDDYYSNAELHYSIPAYDDDRDITVYFCLNDKLDSGEDPISSIESTYLDFYKQLVRAIVFEVLCALAVIICIVILVIKSGRKHGDDELHMMPTDKIFTLLRIAINAAAVCGLVILAADIYFDVYSFSYGSLSSTLAYITCSLIISAAMAFLLDMILFISRSIKNHSLIKNIFIVWLSRKLTAAIKKHKEKLSQKPAVYRDIFNDVKKKIIIGVLLPNLILGIIIFLFCSCSPDDAAFPVIILGIYNILVILYALKYAGSLKMILYSLEQIKNGNYDICIDTQNIPRSVRAYAESVSAIKSGLKIAVENAVKEQRTKTELITNVSHDLKTPLTSIINYVDLLSHCEISDETAQSYISVLGEKSAKLKVLIEDLVEASKASAGSITVNLMTVSLNELIMQFAGEYEDEFKNRQLVLITQSPEFDVNVTADSKMCYRVLDNLMSNVKKYAMPGTRVYLTLSTSASKGVITLKNVSQQPLNISASELMTRFVRGDSSRSTEGNGLGLSIAENFCKLQGGKLSLDISGDLFTATVEYELARSAVNRRDEPI